MDNRLIYMPIFRLRQQEQLVLQTFNFGDRIFPCIEIFKEQDRKNNKKGFKEIHIQIIKSIKAHKVFVDLPVHIRENKRMKSSTISFFRSVIAKRDKRTEYLLELSALSDKVIPVISTYFTRTGEPNSICLQEQTLRPDFPQIAFRTFQSSYKNDLVQIEKAARYGDYLIVDLGEAPDPQEDEGPEDIEFGDIVERLKEFDKCPIIIVRSALSSEIKNTSLETGEVIPRANNRLLTDFRNFNGHCFGDFGGIKKDELTEGGRISPGFIYYDPVENQYFGFRGLRADLEEFERTIIPNVLISKPTLRMQKSRKPFLTDDNRGWQIIQNIHNRKESGKNMAKFKRIAMEHYLHCLKVLIERGEIRN